MKFGPTPIAECEGAILAHGIKTATFFMKKGQLLSADHIARLTRAGIKTVYAARLETGDVPENEAAARLAKTMGIEGPVRIGPAFTGRCNFYAHDDGVCRIEPEMVHALNTIDEAITLATLPDYTRVAKGQMLATIKIIPFSCREESLAKACAIASAMTCTVKPFQLNRTALIMTKTDAVPEKVLAKTHRVLNARLTALGSQISAERHIPHVQDAVETALKEVQPQANLILLSGASAIADRSDVIPAAIKAAGGTIEYFGMPVDPGNLLLLARLNGVPVLGLPGCARSPKLNGADWVMERLAAGLSVTSTDIQRMGAGGLLAEIASRPHPRDAQFRGLDALQDGSTEKQTRKIGAIVLAAGRSRRMAPKNKLLAIVGGKPMLLHTFDALAHAGITDIIAVTGHERGQLEPLLPPECTIVFNPDYAEGLSTSLKTGIAVAQKFGWEAALICLGDMPDVPATTLAQLVAAYNEAEGRLICAPTYRGKRGNPVLWSARFFDSLAGIEGDIGGKALLGQFEDAVWDVDVSTTAIFRDLDTPEALAARREQDR